MKSYLYKHNEIFIVNSMSSEDGLADAYNKLFDQLLLSKNISESKIFQSLNLLNNKISSEPHVVLALLKKEELPGFKFLACKN